MGMAALLDAEGLTKKLVDELIKRIDVYGDDRVQIKWKFSIQDSKYLSFVIYVTHGYTKREGRSLPYGNN